MWEAVLLTISIPPAMLVVNLGSWRNFSLPEMHILLLLTPTVVFLPLSYTITKRLYEYREGQKGETGFGGVSGALNLVAAAPFLGISAGIETMLHPLFLRQGAIYIFRSFTMLPSLYLGWLLGNEINRFIHRKGGNILGID
ncbi:MULTISPECIES: hypothetical protein [Haloferacaceae]|uniref:Uncharacterized protein n=1 Tax=Halorubrum glutamatedens TaxID=2707018 RepID=A0ABD5QN13_9EURY|nr:hypothetical protein [Halobellus captivus]